MQNVLKILNNNIRGESTIKISEVIYKLEMFFGRLPVDIKVKVNTPFSDGGLYFLTVWWVHSVCTDRYYVLKCRTCFLFSATLQNRKTAWPYN